jgi:prepilin-type N-terminal cleavage/methylation domain-containing protein
MNRCPIFREEGFTLLELMIAVTVLMIVLLGSANMLITSIKFNVLTMEKTTAARLAKNKIAELRSIDYQEVGLNIGSHDDPNNPINADESLGGIYTRKWSVSNGTTPGTKDVCATVKWNRGQVVLNSLIADQG